MAVTEACTPHRIWKMRTLVVITVFVSAICAAPQAQDAVSTTFEMPALAKLKDLMPKFLQEASHDARKEFWQIIRNNSNTIAETQSKLQAWADKQGGDVKADFEHAGEKLKERFQSLSDAISQSSLSAATKDAFSHLGEIASDGDQTFGEEVEKIANYVRSLPDETRQEMREFTANAVKSAIKNDD